MYQDRGLEFNLGVGVGVVGEMAVPENKLKDRA